LPFSGGIQRQRVSKLQDLFDAKEVREITLDLEEVRLVDRETVRFLVKCESEGIQLKNCPSYIRQWIEQGAVLAMNRNLERSPSGKFSQSVSTRSVVVRAAEKMESWFRRPRREQIDWELNIRLDERTRERARIARELHDTLFQGFLGVSMQLSEAVQKVPADSPCKLSLDRALCLMQRVIDEGRHTLQGLRSPATPSLSLEQALSSLREELAPAGGVRLRLFVTGQPKPLTPQIQEQVYLIGREAMLNAVRHAQATSIEAEVEYMPRGLRLAVRDNGCGIDPQIVRSGRDCHWGLLGMRERAGNIGAKLRIWSRPGAGTEVEISLSSKILTEVCA
jgi:signal transduction histidine kinase